MTGRPVAYLDTMLLSHLDDAGVDDWVNVRWVVSTLLGVILAAEPLHDIEALRTVELDWVAVEQVRHHNKVAVGSQLVGDELDIVELVADDIGDAIGC
jgi:hypothetical protein